VKRDTHIELGREESNESNQVLPEINMILGGTSTRDNGGNGKKISEASPYLLPTF
jgi:hypothetical protein